MTWDRVMLVRMKDRLADWTSSDLRRTQLAIGLIIAPIWIDLGSLLLISSGLIRSSVFAMFWFPMAIGVLGCFLLPIMSLAVRVVLALAYAPVTLTLLLGFNMTVGCGLTGECL
jgi:hypothetical protein